ncbi:conserved hypothetical protein [uncultured Pleomorphomonas sp.]|uniref:Uncharacterized protein n=1 Tax=uncultured Pleomorphomonas sp. TaxID=442121 RepID=A0A212LQT8_9HYPH|nr:hypothetical protein [uncultured Pleomorphomonas sp.]SCM79882.1 conserved hypothetical protein [uncultured Pleomorphomonas sp.]
MPRIKAVWGPRKTEEGRARITWWFSGMKEDGELCEWKLVYFADTRRFTCRRVMSMVAKERAGKLERKDLFRIPSANGDAIEEGFVTDILKKRLTPEHLAKCAKLSLTYGRAHG